MRKFKLLLLAACLVGALGSHALADDGIMHTGGDKTPPPPPPAASTTSTTASSESSDGLLDESLLTILQALLPRI